MKRLWLIFAQAVTISVAALFVVQTLKPEWLTWRHAGNGVPPLPVAIHQAAPAVDAPRVASYADAAQAALPAVVHIFTSQEVRRHPFLNDPVFRHFFGDRFGPETQRRSGLGSGVIVSADGLVLTNNHVIADADEINLVVSHGSTVSTMPVVEGQQERVISVRQILHAVLRYSENTGMLRLARIRKAHQPAIAELFASIILERPGFFDGDDAQDLYTLRSVELTGPAFAFEHRHDPGIDKVQIIEAAADLMVPGKSGYPRLARTLRSRDLGGDALRHFGGTPVAFSGSWRLGELVFRILFKCVC